MTHRPRPAWAGLLAALLVAACTATTTPAAPSVATALPSVTPPASAAPPPSTAETGAPGTSTSPPATETPGPPPAAVTPVPRSTPGGGGGVPGATPRPAPSGTRGPVGPGGSGSAIPLPPPTAVSPVASLKDVHDVGAEAFSVDGSSGSIRVTIEWWSGPPPCSDLAEVGIARSGRSVTLTVREGTEQLGIACPALAMHKETTVDLGHLDAGDWTIAVTGVDQPQTVHIAA